MIPLLVAVFVYDLGVILELAGMLVFLLLGMLILLHVATKRLFPEKGPFDYKGFNSVLLAWVLLGLSVAFFFISGTFIVLSLN